MGHMGRIEIRHPNTSQRDDLRTKQLLILIVTLLLP
jgi:hypothetical protein